MLTQACAKALRTILDASGEVFATESSQIPRSTPAATQIATLMPIETKAVHEGAADRSRSVGLCSSGLVTRWSHGVGKLHRGASGSRRVSG